ncbi:hypothetical protein Tco_1134857 [Tanacetum coccineum]
MMRAAPPPTPSPPVLLPSTSCRADIPKAGIPPRKRLLLTVPTPRFEVGESSDAARQLGSTVARRVNYSFIDTVDASIRASERRTMTSIEGGRAALRDEVVTLRRYISSLCTTHEHKRVKALLETQAYRHELQRHDSDDRATGHITHIQALEAEARIDTLEDIASRLYGSFVHHLDILYGMLSIMGHSQLALPITKYSSILTSYLRYSKEPPPPDFVLEPVYPEFMPPEDDVLLAEEEPLPVAVLPTTDSPGYITESDLQEDPEEDPEEDDEDPEEDPADYPTDIDDEKEEESSKDDADDEEEDKGEDEEKEEEHLAPADSTVVAFPAVDHAPSAEETEPFEIDEFAATPSPHPAYRVMARISTDPQKPI